MKWEKKGLIFSAKLHSNWMCSHSALPIACHLYDDVYRIFFSTRNIKNQSHVGYFEIDINNPSKILSVSKTPVLKPGKVGFFDDSGSSACCIVHRKQKDYLYYVGWNLKKSVSFQHAIGLATVSKAKTNFQKHSNGPIMDRSVFDPCFCSGNFILLENDLWRMWYSSCYKWEYDSSNNLKHFYHIKYAESQDGIYWKPTGQICLDFENEEEHAFSRPCVIRDLDMYRCWYSVRGERYKIGYAESKDGIKWKRKDDEAGITVSKNSWDSEMLCYPFVFDHNRTRYMLYNGNNYGQTGIGLAVLRE